jgi:putative flippase GtrA
MMARLSNIYKTNHPLQHVLRFMTVGAVGTVIDIVLFATLRVGLGIPALLANTVSYGSGTVNNYVLHRRWTFADGPSKAIRVQFAQFIVVSLSALVVNNLLLLLLEPGFDRLFASSEVGELCTKVCAMSAGMCLSFLANHLWTFRNAAHVQTAGVASCTR